MENKIRISEVLKKCEEFMKCICPNCGGEATREADTLDTFVCSSWYELRYPDAKNDKEAFNRERIDKMAPVDVYVGGKEHAAMHLIYVRFITKALRDMGYLDFDEPFKKLVHQGMILGPDGNKMSKSKGNTVSPDKYVDQYGADVFRMYLMFGFDYKKGGPWSDKGVDSMAKYLSRIERLVDSVAQKESIPDSDNSSKQRGLREKELLRVKNQTIKAMSEDIEQFQFNTAIARHMELLNSINNYVRDNGEVNQELVRETTETYLKLMAPLAPHFSEEQWEKLGKENSIHKEEWPKVNEQELTGGMKKIPIQINGKLRTLIAVNAEASSEEILEVIKSDPRILNILSEYDVKKEIYVPGRIYNIVVSEKNKKVKSNESEKSDGDIEK